MGLPAPPMLDENDSMPPPPMPASTPTPVPQPQQLVRPAATALPQQHASLSPRGADPRQLSRQSVTSNKPATQARKPGRSLSKESTRKLDTAALDSSTPRQPN